MLGEITRNNTSEALVFGPIISSADHVSPALLATLTVLIRKNGGTFAAPSGAVSEVGQGMYKIAPHALDANTFGSLLIHASGAGCDPYDDRYVVVDGEIGRVRQGNTSIDLPFGPLVLTADHITGATGKTLTVTISKNGSAFATPAAAVTEIDYGWYVLAPNAVDAETAGDLAIHATAALCDPYDEPYDVRAVVAQPGIIVLTGNTIVRDAYRLLNIIGATENPSPEQLAEGLSAFNQMLEFYSTHKRLRFHTAKRTRHPFISGQDYYTIGIGGTWNRERPMWIDYWSIIPTRLAAPVVVGADGQDQITSNGYDVTSGGGGIGADEVELPMRRTLGDVEWSRVPNKTIAGSLPYALYYEHTWNGGFGRVHLYPVPDNSSGDVVLYTPMALALIANGTLPISFPPGYARATKICLSKELGLSYPGTMTDELSEEVKATIGWLKRGNFQAREADLDPAITGQGGAYDIYSDGRR